MACRERLARRACQGFSDRGSSATVTDLTQHACELLDRVRACTVCAAQLPFPPRPVFQLHPDARILIAGQAPGRRAHLSGLPFDDVSGDRLRAWMGVDRAEFYDARRIAILPMGLCFPGSGRSGDLPPRPECAPLWRSSLLVELRDLQLTLVVGRHAMDWHLGAGTGSLTARVLEWREALPAQIPLPHPSPRNQAWLARNPWFADELLPALRTRVREVLTGLART